MNEQPTITRVVEGGRKKIIIGMPPIVTGVAPLKPGKAPKEANKDG